MSRPVTISVRLNNDVTVSEFVAIAELADETFDQLWLSNDLFYNSCLAALPIAATRTRRIRLGTGILNPYTVHPAEMAMFATSLSEVAPGRVALGVAAGAEDFLGWVGIERVRPLSSVRSALVALRHLLGARSEPPSDWTPEAQMRARPEELDSTPVPIYLGAMSPKMTELAGELADGVLPLLFPPERYVESRAHVLTGAERSGRDPSDVDIAACVWCSIDDDADAAVSALARKIAYYGSSFSPHVLAGLGLEADDLRPARAALLDGDPDRAERLLPSVALRLGIAGAAVDVIERCEGLLEIGATHVSFGPPIGPDLGGAIKILQTEVAPVLAARGG